MEFGNQFEGRGVVVTGALGLFGQGLARVFAAQGAKICATDRDAEALAALLADMDAPAGSFVHAADLTRDDDLTGLVEAVGQMWGSADVVINNAGIYPSGFMLDIDVSVWDKIMGVNLRAPFVLTRGFALQMIDRRVKGAIINVSSGASRKMRRTVVPYCVSKTALDRLTKGFALELAEFGIRVNALEPGFMAGSEVSQLTKEHVARVTSSVPMGRTSSIDDVGPAALYLASDAAAYVTGTTLTVDGGNSIGSLEVFQEKKTPL
ncbi:MAG: SDR family NAD(P)-dependent oxidoreductase [Devosia sp.]